MNIIAFIFVVLFYVIQAPFSAAGYIAGWVSAFWYFGFSAATRHQEYLISLSDKRKQQKDKAND